jgi:hypothetical protein
VYRSVGLWAALATIAGFHDLTLPRRVMPTGGESKEGSVPLTEAAQLCLDEASRFAGKLDGRNGTTRYAQRLHEVEEAIRKSVEMRDRGEGDEEDDADDEES